MEAIDRKIGDKKFACSFHFTTIGCQCFDACLDLKTNASVNEVVLAW